jgi:hypothetical protein
MTWLSLSNSWVTHSIPLFTLSSPFLAHLCAITFRMSYNTVPGLSTAWTSERAWLESAVFLYWGNVFRQRSRLYYRRRYRSLLFIATMFWSVSGQSGAHGGTGFEALCYKPEGRGIKSRWCHWNFSLTILPAALWLSTQPLTEISTRNISWG